MLISLTEDCYQAMRQLREQMKEQKRQMGQPEKTTFSEIVFMFIQKYQQPMTTQNDGQSLTSTPPIKR
jgi:hypothetical protein